MPTSSITEFIAIRDPEAIKKLSEILESADKEEIMRSCNNPVFTHLTTKDEIEKFLNRKKASDATTSDAPITESANPD